MSIDDVINMVALRVNRKEQLLKQQTELKVQLEI